MDVGLLSKIDGVAELVTAPSIDQLWFKAQEHDSPLELVIEATTPGAELALKLPAEVLKPALELT